MILNSIQGLNALSNHWVVFTTVSYIMYGTFWNLFQKNSDKDTVQLMRKQRVQILKFFISFLEAFLST